MSEVVASQGLPALHPVDSVYLNLPEDILLSAINLQSLRLQAATENNCIAWNAALTAHLAQAQNLPESSFFSSDFTACDTSDAGAIFFYQLGVLQFFNEQWDKAEGSMQRSLQLASRKEDKIIALNGLSGLHHHLGDMQKAWKLMRQAYEVDTLETDPLILTNLALFSIETQRYDEAIYWSRRSLDAVQEEEGQLIAQANLCLAYLGKKNFRQAQKTFSTLNTARLVSLMPIQSASLILNYGLRTNAQDVLEKWMEPLSRLKATWPPSARSFFGWDWLLMEWPSKPAGFWLQLAGSIPEEFGGVSLELPSRNPNSAPLHFKIEKSALDMGLRTLPWVFGILVVGIWIHLGSMLWRIRKIRSISNPRTAFEELMEFVRTGKRAGHSSPVRLFERWIASSSRVNHGLAHVPNWQVLTEKEQELLKWVHLGKGPKESAQILGCSPEHVYNMRTRIRQKLHIEENKDLREWLEKFRSLSVIALMLISASAWGQRNGLRTPHFNELSTMEWPVDSTKMDSVVRFHLASINPSNMNLPEIRLWTTACLLTGKMEGIQRLTHRVEQMVEVDSVWVADILREVRWAYDPWYSKWAEVLRMQAIQWDGAPGAPIALTPQTILQAEAPRFHRRNKIHSEELEKFWSNTQALHEWAIQDREKSIRRWGIASAGLAVVLILSLTAWKHISSRYERADNRTDDALLVEEKAQIIPLLKKLESGNADSTDSIDLLLALSACAYRRGETLPEVGHDHLKFSSMEKRFAAYLLAGNSTSEIAEKLNCSTSRIYNIRSSVRTKLGTPRQVPIERALLEQWTLARWIRTASGNGGEGEGF